MQQRYSWAARAAYSLRLCLAGSGLLLPLLPGAARAQCPTGTRLYVKADPTLTVNGTGESWTTAYISLADALEKARTCATVTEIWVAEGTYKPAFDATGTAATAAPRTRTFLLKSGVSLYGGFAGTEAALADRTAGHETILSGDFNGDDVTTGSGSNLAITGNSENAYHVLLATNLPASPATGLSGFSIRGGNAVGAPMVAGTATLPPGSAGGLGSNSSTLTLTDCAFSGNAALSGGGLYGISSALKLIGCTFSNNATTSTGGGMVSGTSTLLTLSGCTFSGNRAATNGGGLTNSSAANSTFTNCTFSNNAANSGGGINTAGGTLTSLKLTGCLFSGNKATSTFGGGIAASSSAPTLTNCVFSGNTAATNGGGLYNINASPALFSCIFVGNAAAAGGGGYFTGSSSSSTLVNCTLTGNTATGNGGGLFFDTSTGGMVRNAILWNNTNTAATPAQQNIYKATTTASPSVSNSIVGDYVAGFGGGTTNISGSSSTISKADPRFVNAADPDGPDNIFGTTDDGLALQAGPAVDLGSSGTPTTPVTDITGAPRSGLPDAGAYEFQCAGGTRLYVNAAVTTPGNGATWATAIARLSDALRLAKTTGGCGATVVEIWVAEGTYTPAYNGNTVPTDLRTRTFQLKSGVSIYGGFAGTEAALADRTAGHETVLSGDFNGNDQYVFSNNAENAYSVLTGASIPVSPATVLDGLSVRGGNANGGTAATSRGGGFTNTSGSGPTLTNCVFSGNSALIGGGLYNASATVVLSNCTFSGNRATYVDPFGNSLPNNSGGGMYNIAAPTITGCTFSDNLASSGAGMYNTSSSLTLTNCTLSNNQGEGMYNASASPTLMGCTLSNNQRDGMYNTASSPTLTDCTLSNNRYNGMYNEAASAARLTRCILNNNLYGGMYNHASSPMLTTCTLSGNTASFYSRFQGYFRDGGGGMYNEAASSPVLTGCTFSNNTCTYYGGAIFNNASSPQLTNCTFDGNSAQSAGAMFGNDDSSPTLTGCTFRNNTATSEGGALYCYGNSTLTLTGCTFSGNRSAAAGGAIDAVSGTQFILTNCVFTNNVAANLGGAIQLNPGITATLTNCTLTGNSVTKVGTVNGFTYGGGGISTNSPITLTNCILWNNTGGPANQENLFEYSTPSVVTVANSTVGDYSATASTYAAKATNISTTDPRFVNGASPAGPDALFGTLDDGLSLLPGSPAIDASDPATANTAGADIVGNARVAIYDQGAYEAVPRCAVTAVAQAATLLLAADGTATLTPAAIDNGSTSACTIALRSVTPNTFTCADLGPHAVTLTVTALDGTISTAPATVTVGIPVLTSTTWTGRASTDPADCANWSYGQGPTAGISAVVPTGLTNYPALATGTTAVNDLTIDVNSRLTLAGGATLEVSGNFLNNGTADLLGTVAFVGSAATQTLGGSTATLFSALTVAKPAGTVQLARDLTVAGALTLTSGTLTTTSYQVNLGSTASLSESETGYVLGKVAVNRTLAPGTAETFAGLGLTLTPAAGSTAPGATLVTRTTGTALDLTGTSQSILRNFDIQPATNTGLDVTMDFAYFTHELNGIPAANLALLKSVSGTAPWITQSGTTATGNVVTKTGIVDFSVWTLGSSTNPLPVELKAFTATPQGSGTVRLDWATASEMNSKVFDVERSANGTSFERIGTVAAAGTSSTTRRYMLPDAELPASATQLYYRLKQVDLDGTFSYSPVRTVNLTGTVATSLTLYPNPTHGGAATLTGGQPGTVVTVLDALGRPVTSATTDAAGTAALKLPAGLAAGIYVVRNGTRALRLTVE
ncbi:right-handed parallel beta-helix repeat-containing protein [Hymenobacter chitinivorans]|uniref:Putative outer membrane repeat protein/parallel beta-helix repeat protein n=1 Tax=Hymenobacter chitinivorans DSM 11115 TaxID=1121954 RepID=A0A2M9BM04_9BACT|nr:right-handed parallel beta-helix repeat-containing protein [Hymenobacter chitinivorans]PJJ58955.1 putative outer membrane repeat protein/parallel beta-helix repeat protein [Hymenobacter chitinivorans DSM 11115]